MATTHVLFLVLLMSMMPLLDCFDASDIINDITDNMENILDDITDWANDIDFTHFTEEDTTKFEELINEQGNLSEDEVETIMNAMKNGGLSNLDKNLLAVLKKVSAAWSNSGTRGSAAVAVVLPILMLTINMVM